MNGIPYYTVKRLLKQYVSKSISTDYINTVKTVIDSVIKQLTEASITNLNNANELRRLHNLPSIKRLYPIHIPKVLNTLKPITTYGSTGVMNNNTDESKAGE